MRYGNARFGQELFEFFTPVLDGVDFVVQKVNLATAFEFAEHGFAYNAIAFAAHKGLDGQTALRSGGNHA